MRQVDDPRLKLRIVGNPATPQMRSLVEEACAQDPRISALLAYVEEPVLAREVSEAELVVLPYRQMHNSGTLLLALSLARPVLAPWSESNAAIAEEVGPGWVFLYEGEFDAALLTGMLDKVRAAPRGAAPDLSQRDWATDRAAALPHLPGSARQGWRRRAVTAEIPTMNPPRRRHSAASVRALPVAQR